MSDFDPADALDVIEERVRRMATPDVMRVPIDLYLTSSERLSGINLHQKLNHDLLCLVTAVRVALEPHKPDEQPGPDGTLFCEWCSDQGDYNPTPYPCYQRQRITDALAGLA